MMQVTWRSAWLGLAALSLSVAAYAAPTLESERFESRGDAASLARAITGEGQRARPVRVLEAGVGWRWFVRVEGFSDDASARAVGEILASRVGHGLSLVGDDGAVAERFAAPVAPAAGEGEPGDALETLQASAMEHRGARASSVDDIKRWAFRFERKLPDGSVAEHLVARDGAAMLLDVSGKGIKPSRTLVTAEGAWLAVDGGDWVAQDRERTEETLKSFLPTRVVPFVLAFPYRMEERRELQLMHLNGQETVDGTVCDVLAYDGDKVSGSMQVDVGTKDHLVRRVTFAEGEANVMHRFTGWRELPGFGWMPSTVETIRDGVLTDVVQPLAFDLAPNVPQAWFTPVPR